MVLKQLQLHHQILPKSSDTVCCCLDNTKAVVKVLKSLLGDTKKDTCIEKHAIRLKAGKLLTCDCSVSGPITICLPISRLLPFHVL